MSHIIIHNDAIRLSYNAVIKGSFRLSTMTDNYPRPDMLRLADLVTGFACSLPYAQLQLDQDWASAIDQYANSLPPEACEWLGLPLMLAPARQILVESNMTAEFLLCRNRSTEMNFKVTLVNLAMARKFAYSECVCQKLAVKVVRSSTKEEYSHG
jgi:hypothetical protein